MKIIIFTLILLTVLQSKAYTLTVKPIEVVQTMPHGGFGQKELSKPTQYRYININSGFLGTLVQGATKLLDPNHGNTRNNWLKTISNKNTTCLD